MHKKIGKFKIENVGADGKDYLVASNGIMAEPVVIVDYDTSRILQSKYHVMSIHFGKKNDYSIDGMIFKESNMLFKVLKLIGSEEIE